MVISAAWLHDVLDHKMIKSEAEYTEKEYAIQEFLSSSFDADDSKLVLDIIANISFSKEVCSILQTIQIRYFK